MLRPRTPSGTTYGDSQAMDAEHRNLRRLINTRCCEPTSPSDAEVAVGGETPSGSGAKSCFELNAYSHAASARTAGSACRPTGSRKPLSGVDELDAPGVVLALLRSRFGYAAGVLFSAAVHGSHIAVHPGRWKPICCSTREMISSRLPAICRPKTSFESNAFQGTKLCASVLWAFCSAVLCNFLLLSTAADSFVLMDESMGTQPRMGWSCSTS